MEELGQGRRKGAGVAQRAVHRRGGASRMTTIAVIYAVNIRLQLIN